MQEVRMRKNRKLGLLIMMAVLLLLSACFSTAASTTEEESYEPALFLYKKNTEHPESGDLYVKRMNQEPEKVAGNVQMGAFQASPDARHLLFLDTEGSLYYWKAGTDKEKVDAGVELYTVTFVEAENKVYYLNEDKDLYVKEIGKDKNKLASDVYSFKLAKGGLVYYIDSDDQLYRLPASGDKEKLSSDVSYFSLSADGKAIIYESNEQMLYVIPEKGEKQKLSKTSIGEYDISSQGSWITVTEDYNADKGHGELYLLKKDKAEYSREKIASDVQDHFISADDKTVYYLNSDKSFYQYDIKSQEKVKLLTEAQDLQFNGDISVVASLTKDEELYIKETGKDPEKLASDVTNFWVEGDAVFFTDKDDSFYIKLQGQEKQKLALEMDTYHLSRGQVYYVTKDRKQIGIVLPGKTEGTVLLDSLEGYQQIYSRDYRLYEKLAQIDDIAGYWHYKDENGYFYIEKKNDKEAAMTLYRLNEEETMQLQVEDRTENTLSVVESGQEDDPADFVVKGKDSMEFQVDGDTIELTRSSKEEVDKLKAKTEEENKQIRALLESNLKAAEEENLDAYLATIDPDSQLYEDTWETIGYLFESIDGLTYEIEEYEMIEREEGEAVVELVQVTKGDDEYFTDNRSYVHHTVIRMEDGTWKLTSSEMIDFEYLEE